MTTHAPGSRTPFPSYVDDHSNDEEGGTTGVVELQYQKAEEIAKEREAAADRLREKMRKLRESVGAK
jgi:hypothetical protein